MSSVGVSIGGAREHAAAPTDAQLLAGVAQAQPAALEMLYDRYSRLAYSLALRILGDARTAEEAVEDAFLSVWRHRGVEQPEPGGIRASLCAMVRGRAIERLRPAGNGAACRGSADLTGDRRPAPSVVGVGAVAPAAPEIVQRALGALPPGQRDVLELAYFAGLSPAAIGELLAVPPGTVRSQTRSALRSLSAAEHGGQSSSSTDPPVVDRRSQR